MPHPVKGIDHCFVLVDNLDAAAAQYGALGFTLSPRGLHSESKGSANYTIMFPDDYLELLGLLKPTDMNAARRQTLAEQGQGLHAIACRIDNAEDAARDLEALGIATEGLGSFDRPVDLPDGSKGVAAFSTVSFAPSEVPFGMVFMCQHKTPETVWLPELLTHPNTACGLGAFYAMSDAPQRDADRFARLWADGTVHPDAQAIRIETGANSAPLILMTRDDMARRYPGLDLSATASGAFTAVQIRVRDLDAARDCLDRAGLDCIQTETGVAIAPQSAGGAIIEFTPA